MAFWVYGDFCSESGLRKVGLFGIHPHPIKKATYQGGFISKNLLKHWRDNFAENLKVAPVLVVDLE